jgi:hypothetical protein
MTTIDKQRIAVVGTLDALRYTFAIVDGLWTSTSDEERCQSTALKG